MTAMRIAGSKLSRVQAQGEGERTMRPGRSLAIATVIAVSAGRPVGTGSFNST
jgi:hypothetical protein